MYICGRIKSDIDFEEMHVLISLSNELVRRFIPQIFI